jgi:succinoglycan biosynthesis transport protein ExoP
LIDLDLRRPALMRELRRRSPDLGIVDCLLSGISLDAVVIRDQECGFDMIPLGRQHADPTSLLTSDRMGTLLEELRRKYDCIIVDTPPLLGITDARIFAQRADTVVVVVQWAKTPSALAQSAIKLLRRARADIAGVVLTQANMKKHARYGCGDTGTFYKKYKSYYQG